MQIASIFRNLCSGRRFLFKCCLAGMFFGLVIVFSIPCEYETQVFCATEITTFEIEAEQSAATVVGFNDKLRMRDAIRPRHYAQIVGSTPFLASLLDIPVAFTETDTIILYEYINDHQRSAWWNVMLSFPYKVFRFAAGLFEDDEIFEKRIEQGSKADNIFWLTPNKIAAIEALNRRINVESDLYTVTIAIRMQDPLVSAILADTITSRIRTYITDYRTKKEFNTVEYIEKVHEEARQRYHSSQEAYAHFADRNRDLASKVAQSELQKLRVEMNLTYTDYMRLSSQLQAAKGRAAKIRPVYTVIEPAKVPFRPATPSPVKIICVCVVMFFFAGCGWIWIKLQL